MRAAVHRFALFAVLCAALAAGSTGRTSSWQGMASGSWLHREYCQPGPLVAALPARQHLLAAR